jgi:hypothetical protein
MCMEGSSSGCLIVGFGMSSIKPSGFATTLFVMCHYESGENEIRLNLH